MELSTAPSIRNLGGIVNASVDANHGESIDAATRSGVTFGSNVASIASSAPISECA